MAHIQIALKGNAMSNKLTSLSERVDQILTADRICDRGQMLDEIYLYNKFLKTDLLSNYFSEEQEYHFLNRFVPCTVDGEILEEPYEGMFEIQANEKCSGWAYLKKDTEHSEDHRYYDKRAFTEAMKIYQRHLSKVMFEGLEVFKDRSHHNLDWVGIYGRGIFWNQDKYKWLKHLAFNTISDLTPLNLTLTDYGAICAGIKQ